MTDEVAVEHLSRPSNPDAVKLAERLGPYSVQLRLTEDCSGEHREWAQEYTIPQGHPLIGEIAADVAALSRQPYPAPDVERVARALVEPLGYSKQAGDNWDAVWVGSNTDTPETGSLAYLCRSLARAALAATGEGK